MPKPTKSKPFESFEKLTRAIASVPKAEIDEKAKAYERQKATRRRPRKRKA